MSSSPHKVERPARNPGWIPRGGLQSTWAALALLVASAALLAGCAGAPISTPPTASPDESKAQINRLLPPNLPDRAGWVADLYDGFRSLRLEPNAQRICAVVAVIQQESNFRVNPVIPGLGGIAMREIESRAARAGLPVAIVHAALKLTSSNGRSYEERIHRAKTEKDLSDAYEDFIGRVPLGRTLLESRNPVRTRGPMQVNIAFASDYSADHPYPYPVRVSVADELFTRRGSVYFGMAHLLDYSAPYDSYLYRFADFNAGRYSSRNAAFQRALGIASGKAVAPDGALLPHEGNSQTPGATELAARSLAGRLKLSDSDIHSDLAQERTHDFEGTDTYKSVFALAERSAGHALPRAVVPQIVLHGPKISRSLTTDWYAHRVDGRFRRCLKQ